MADALKLKVRVIYSENSDYSDPQWKSNLADVELTPDEASGVMIVEAPTTPGYTVEIGYLTTVSLVIVQNTDSTNSVDVGYDSLNGGGGISGIVVRLGPGDIHVTQDVDEGADLNLTGIGGTVRCKVIVAGT